MNRAEGIGRMHDRDEFSHTTVWCLGRYSRRSDDEHGNLLDQNFVRRVD